jgi:hypothetical protein
MGSITWQEYVRSREDEFDQSVMKAFNLLMREKHLYQSVSVPGKESYLVKKPGTEKPEVIGSVETMMMGPWLLKRPPSANALTATASRRTT